jgi:hypothetical protein
MGNLIPFRRNYEDMYVKPDFSYFVPQQESPETAIARTNPEIACDLLKDISNKVLYKNLAQSATDISGTYLECMKEVEAPALKESSELSITVLKEFTKGRLSNLFFGAQELGFSMTIKLK